MVFKIGMWHSRLPPFMANGILNFHFDYPHLSLIYPPYMYYICIWPVTRWLRRWPLLWQLIGFEHSSYLPGCFLNLHNLNLLILNVNIKRGRVELYSPRWKILGGSRQKGYQKRSLQITEHSKHSAGEKWGRQQDAGHIPDDAPSCQVTQKILQLYSINMQYTQHATCNN